MTAVALLAPATIEAATCTRDGELLTCPTAWVEKLRADYLEERRAAAELRAELERQTKDAAARAAAEEELCASLSREGIAAATPAPSSRSWAPAVGVVLGIASGAAGGACLGASSCPAAVGWGGVLLGAVLGLGGLVVGW